MPFNYQVPRRYSFEVISEFDRYALGVYGLLRDDICVYVGKGNIHDELLRYLNGENPCIRRERPNLWVFEIYNNNEEIRTAREAELINELKPICNIQHPQVPLSPKIW